MGVDEARRDQRVRRSRASGARGWRGAQRRRPDPSRRSGRPATSTAPRSSMRAAPGPSRERVGVEGQGVAEDQVIFHLGLRSAPGVPRVLDRRECGRGRAGGRSPRSGRCPWRRLALQIARRSSALLALAPAARKLPHAGPVAGRACPMVRATADARAGMADRRRHDRAARGRRLRARRQTVGAVPRPSRQATRRG